MPAMPKFALLCPGQGSQTVGMGAALAAASPTAREVLDRADAAFGGGLAKLMTEGPQEELTRTTNAQPALLTASAMAQAVLRESTPDLAFSFGAGHSLGEFSAIVGAGALALEEAVPLVRDRGAYMQEAVPVGEGAMAACLGDIHQVEALTSAVVGHGPLEIANYNGPGQVVISGTAEAVKHAASIAKQFDIKRVIPLEVSAPFHSSLMAPARDRFAERIRDVPFHPFAFPVVTNLEASPNDDPTRLPDLLTQQITSPVRWTQVCQCLLDNGCEVFIECGPGNVLTNMLKRGWKDYPVTCCTISDPETLAATLTTLKELPRV